ncbi:hypothetical protein GVAV_000489 [Gurleya vavrai]
MNIQIALIDTYLLYLLDSVYYTKSHRFSKSVVLSILIEEAPTYFFAFLFNFVENNVLLSCKPYFNFVSLLYIITGFINYSIDKIDDNEQHKERHINQDLKKNLHIDNVFVISNNLLNCHILYMNCKKETNLKNIIKVIKIYCTSTDTFVYFFLMTEMKEQNFLLIYFSIEILMKAITYIPKQKKIYNFCTIKIIFQCMTVLSVVCINVFGHYLIILMLFIINGVLNRIINLCYENLLENETESVKCQMIIFGIVSIFVIYYGQNPDQSFEDFIFFSSVRL